MTALLVLIVLASAPVQVAVSTALFREPLAAPVLPVALIAAWAAMRSADETWPAVVLPAVVLGAASEERVGWFLLALLPAPLLAGLAVQRLRPRATGLAKRIGTAGLVAAGGAAGYALVLTLASRMSVPALAPALLGSAMLSALLAVLLAACLAPLRRRERGLFG